MLTLDLFKTFTTLDIETTGLEKDARIIEIGLAHYENGRCVGTWQTLINPSMTISYDISLLTGITNEMVQDAPIWDDIVSDFLQEIEGKTLIAHNISFDKSHLEYHLGFELKNQYLDTYDLAKLFLPCKSSYKLQALAQFLGVSDLNHHRALNDALVCGEVYLKILEHAIKISPYALLEVANMLTPLDPYLSDFCHTIETESAISDAPIFELPKKEENLYQDTPALTFKNAPDFFLKDGLLSQNMPQFEYRLEQLEMLKTIQKAFTEHKHAIIEAGTGTGKSFSYLVAGLLYAYEHDEKVIVSTNTMTLQEQLYHKDLPFLKKVLGYPFSVTISKGRNNYLCLRRFEALKKDTSLSKDELLFIASLVIWEERTTFGDKEELNLNNLETQFWHKVSSTTETCFNKSCPNFTACYYFNNRRSAQESQLIIVNHSLLLQHVKTDHNLLPKASALIIDEAHHLEDEAIKQFTTTIDFNKLKRQVFTLTRKRGLTDRLSKRLELSIADHDEKEEILEQIHHLNEVGEPIGELSQEIISLANQTTILATTGEYRLNQKQRRSQWWQDLQAKISVYTSYLLTLSKKLTYLLTLIESNSDYETIYREGAFTLSLLEEGLQALETFLNGDNDNMVYWLNAQNNNWGGNFLCCMAYIDISKLMKASLFDFYPSVILTSATLATSNGLDYTAQNYLLEKEDYLSYICTSPFDYHAQSLIAILNHRPDYSKVNDLTYGKHIAEDLEVIIPAINGGILILFTSYAMMNRVALMLKESHNLKNYHILCHGQDGNRNSIIETMKKNLNTIVLGTSSFWEGVDISGDYLKAVIITKLPFSPPTMPIESARAEHLEKNGKSAFTYLSLPKAVLRFRQGVGRLIRSKNDKGVIIILDNRIVRKNYGKSFLNVLPEQTKIKGDSTDIAFKIASWLNKPQ